LNKQILDSVNFQNDLRKRLNQFVEENRGEGSVAELKRLANENAKELGVYKEFVRTRLQKGNIWSWHAVVLNFDASRFLQPGGFHWAYHLRNTILEEVAHDSTSWQAYCAFLLSLNFDQKKMPTVMANLHAKAEAAEKVKREKEEKHRLEEEEKAKKTAKPAKPAPSKPDPSKKTADKLNIDKKDLADEQGKLSPDTSKSKLDLAKSLVVPDSAPVRRPRLHPQTDQWKKFEIINKQIGDLPVSSVTSGVILEAYIDEIEASIVGDLPIHFPAEEEKKEGHLGGILDSIFSQLLSSK
jgi:hypothetical protein